MSDEGLAQVGQQVVDTIVSVYLPDGDDSLTLAVHPGQAIADNVVQSGTSGPTTNPLVLSEWIADQYDYPLLLKRSDETTVVSSLSASVTGKAGYAAMVPWATPSLPTESSAFARVASLISTARQSLGANPEVLPFGCEPDDFAEPGSPGWHEFDTKVANTHTQTTTEGQPSAIRADPDLWRMRALPSSVVEALPARAEIRRESTELLRKSVRDLDVTLASAPLVLDRAILQRNVERFAVERQPTSPVVLDAALLQQDVAFATEQPATSRMAVEAALLHPNIEQLASEQTASLMRATPFESAAVGERMSYLVSPAQATKRRLFHLQDSDSAAVLDPAVLLAEPAPQQPVAEESHATIDLRSLVVSDALTLVQTEDLANAPAVSQTTTESSELHVHFEYQLVRITRRVAGSRWWREELVIDPNWYVPGMRKGDMFNSPEGDVTLCLPQALIVVRNVSITGSWTDEARATMRSGVTYIGPFLVAPPSESDESRTAGESFSILGSGVQVIGELCSPLPSLPPMDDPALHSSPHQ